MTMQYQFDPSRRRQERPDWLPDWRDASRYQIGSRRQLAWEFLRRNPEYWTDWRRWNALPDVEGDEQEQRYKSPKWEWTVYIPWASMYYYCGTYPTLPGETVEQYRRRTGETPTHLAVHLERQWGIAEMRNPASSSPPPVSEACVQRPPYLADSTYVSGGERDEVVYSVAAEGALPTDLWMFALDLRHPIPQQLERLAAHLAALQQARIEHPIEPTVGQPLRLKLRHPGKSRHADQLRSCLRAYDAAWTGATGPEIARALYPGSWHGQNEDTQEASIKRVKSAIGDAKRLMQWDFRLLFSTSGEV
jgi:hypothetical protein